MFSEFRNEVLEILRKAILEAKESDLVEPPEGAGDLGYPCFSLAKTKGTKPNEAAKDLSASLRGAGKKLVSEVRTFGPYVNFFIDWSAYASAAKEATSRDWGSSQEGRGKKVLVEYSSPNIAKPMHAGHLMTTIIGDSIHRIMKARGYNVIRINHMGDWGTQFGKLIVAYQKWGDEGALKREPIKELVRVYVKFHEEAEKDTKLEAEARDAFADLEKGDKKLRAMWKRFVDASLQEFKRTYAELEVDFDEWTGESFYEGMLHDVIEDAVKKIAQEDQGSLIIKFDDLPPMLIRKSDGSSLYATRDLAALKYRASHFKFHKCIYVVGNQQSLHFQQVFRAAGMLGYADPARCVHVPTGFIVLPEGKMSTRKGNAILAEEILDKARELSARIVEEKNPKIRNKEDVIKKVAIGAIKYANLAQHRGKDVIFEWEKVVNLKGNSGPYLQYTSARASSILAEAKPKKVKLVYESPHERSLLLKISKFPDAVANAALTLTPHHVAVYCHELAEIFNRFYENCPVLKAEEPVRSSRLLLVAAFKNTMARGLGLLGIDALEEM